MCMYMFLTQYWPYTDMIRKIARIQWPWGWCNHFHMILRLHLAESRVAHK